MLSFLAERREFEGQLPQNSAGVSLRQHMCTTVLVTALLAVAAAAAVVAAVAAAVVPTAPTAMTAIVPATEAVLSLRAPFVKR